MGRGGLVTRAVLIFPIQNRPRLWGAPLRVRLTNEDVCGRRGLFFRLDWAPGGRPVHETTAVGGLGLGCGIEDIGEANLKSRASQAPAEILTKASQVD